MKYTIFVINLNRSPDRLAFMHDQFDKIGLSFDREAAVDGESYDFSHDYDEKLFIKRNKGLTANAGIKGCALSHRNTMQRMLDEGLDYALILEDDIELRSDFKDILEHMLADRESGKASWEYLSFNYPSVGWKSIHLWLFLFFEMAKFQMTSFKFWIKAPLYLLKFCIITPLYLAEGIRELVYKRMYQYGTPAYFIRPLYLAGCYLITRDGAKKCIALNTPITYTADGLPNNARIKSRLHHQAFVPLVATQRRSIFGSLLKPDMKKYDAVVNY